LNFGLSAPIDIQIQSTNTWLAYEYAKTLRDRIRKIPGATDVVIKQIVDYPSYLFTVDRARAAQVGITQRDISSSLLVALSSNSLVAPSYYLNPENGVNYTVAVKVPIREIKSVQELLYVPVTSSISNPILQNPNPLSTSDYPTPPTQTIGNLGTLESTVTLNQVNHLNIQRILDVTASVEDRDLGSVVREVRKAIRSLGDLPKGMEIQLRGQNEVMEESFTKLGFGMILAAVLVYLLMVTLFQSWLDPLIIMAAIPGTLAGILWFLAITQTTINVESLMGSIMAIGIAVSNSNLLVNFANDIQIMHPGHPTEAALEAGKVRLRPILMTALAMILGMLPMAIGTSDAGSQNAPLGRAVIGGLILSTLTTLFIIPVVYATLRKKMPQKHEVQKIYHQEEAAFDEEMRAQNHGY
jgi:multidrug efflux pump subunit AcrB